MHDLMSLTYLYPAGIEPHGWHWPPPAPRRRRRRARAVCARLLLAAGGALLRAGTRLAATAPPARGAAPA